MLLSKKFLDKLTLKIIPNSYIKRRHFHQTTFKKDSLFIMSIFNNQTLRNSLYRFANLISKFKLSNSIYYRLYVYQKAPIIQNETIYNQPLHEIDSGIETRKALFLSTN